ncbi:MAG: 16S rRNA (cytosine(1402)-N(4))-methyltransferase RsmH, partial [Actinobacteria bacterium]|nr:16S rRNA (cytosine(1402)-N(4))-methyltransferase RsmH [Actinomycetota bacterium]
MVDQHTPVLFRETIEALQPRDGATYVDCTVGGGGHSAALLEAAGPSARLLGLDADPDDLAVARERLAGFGGRVRLVNANFRRLAEVAEGEGFVPADGVLFDLGMSSIQLDQSSRGFSFQRDAPLDMRFDPRQPTTAADIVNGAEEAELRRMLFEYGNERNASRVARAIVKRRQIRRIETTKELSDVVVGALGLRREGIHSATKTFQALRIAVNEELESLREALPQALRILSGGGRLAVISFHSLEDRIVKEFMRYEASSCICPPGLPVCICG